MMSLKEGVEETFVFFWPTPTDGVAEGTSGALAFVVCKRRGGFLLALPVEVFSREELEAILQMQIQRLCWAHMWFSRCLEFETKVLV